MYPPPVNESLPNETSDAITASADKEGHNVNNMIWEIASIPDGITCMTLVQHLAGVSHARLCMMEGNGLMILYLYAPRSAKTQTQKNMLWALGITFRTGKPVLGGKTQAVQFQFRSYLHSYTIIIDEATIGPTPKGLIAYSNAEHDPTPTQTLPGPDERTPTTGPRTRAGM
eukprot:470103-Rhodomonas_salina.1